MTVPTVREKLLLIVVVVPFANAIVPALEAVRLLKVLLPKTVWVAPAFAESNATLPACGTKPALPTLLVQLPSRLKLKLLPVASRTPDEISRLPVIEVAPCRDFVPLPEIVRLP